MSEYLSKEEIKQWRSSLEKITLEEYAARLGKKIEEAKPTNDLIDIVLQGKPVMSNEETWFQAKGERICTIAQRAYEREQEISPSPFSVSKIKIDLDLEDVKPEKKTESKAPVKTIKPSKIKAETKKTPKPASQKSIRAKAAKQVKTEIAIDTLREQVRIVFKKALTDREQKVFDHFAKNKNQVVYAKDLAGLLDLPRDYVYKYIKNLRAKIEGEKLENADKGGFILHV